MAAKKILLVDYQKNVQNVLQEFGRQKRMEILISENGQDALDTAKEEKPDLIIMRKDIPTLDALSDSVLLKETESTAHIPVIVICSGATGEEKERFRDAGLTGCLEEPITIESLKNSMAKWL